MKKGGGKSKIKFKVPKMPHSLRGFIEKVVTDDRAFKTMGESPEQALLAAGIPIEQGSMTVNDQLRLIKVVANIRKYVEKGKFEKVIFEEIFDIGDEVAVANKQSETYAVENRKWDASEPDMAVEKGSNSGVSKNFDDAGIGRQILEERVIAPLLSPTELTEIFVRIDEKINAMWK